MVLKDEPHIGSAKIFLLPFAHCRDLFAEDANLPFHGRIDGSYDVQKRGLANSAGSLHRNDFTGAHSQIQVPDHMDDFAFAAIGLGHPLNLYGCYFTHLDFSWVSPFPALSLIVSNGLYGILHGRLARRKKPCKAAENHGRERNTKNNVEVCIHWQVIKVINISGNQMHRSTIA